MTEQERRKDGEMRDMVDRIAERAARAAATQAVPQAIETTLRTFGFDTDDPIKIQKNMAFLDESRQRCEKFYGEMFNNFTRLTWFVVKLVMVAGVLAILAKLGIDASGLGGWFSLSKDVP